MTSDEVAARLGVKPALMRTWRNRGKGPKWHKFGSSVVYTPADVAAWELEQMKLARERRRRKEERERLKRELDRLREADKDAS